MTNEELLLAKKRIGEILPYGAVKNNLDMIIDMVKPIIEKQEMERIAKELDETPKQYRPDYKVCFDKNDWLKFLDKLDGKP